MKKLLSLLISTSFILNSSATSLILLNQLGQKELGQKELGEKKLEETNDFSAEKYAKETSIFAKSLIIGKDKGFNSKDLLIDMNEMLNSSNNISFNNINNGNDFINNLTINLDADSINNIQGHFQRNGSNQGSIDEIKDKIKSYGSYKSSIDEILKYINNKDLSGRETIILAESFLKNLKDSDPALAEKVSTLTNFSKPLVLMINNLVNDWDQQQDHGNSPISAMRNYIASEKGNIAQAKKVGSKDQWHYVAGRAGSWSWGDFYQYIAGANLNYMIKILSGDYLGDLIDERLHLGPINWGFDKELFLQDLSDALAKLPTTIEAWPYLIQLIVPIIKTKILKLKNPTLGLKNLTWGEANSDKDLVLKTFLEEIKNLLSPEGQDDLKQILTDFLTGPFGEDIIINLGLLGYYTLPELLDVANNKLISAIIGSGLKPEVLAQQIASSILELEKQNGFVEIFDDLIEQFEHLEYNPNLSLEDFAADLNILFEDGTFETGLNQIFEIINNPETSKYRLAEIFDSWGVQKDQEEFRSGSCFAHIKNWIDDPDSILNQILDLFFATGENSGIITNIIKEQQELLANEYQLFFDIDNEEYFELVVDPKLHIKLNGTELSYDLLDKISDKTYSLVFLKKNNSNRFLLTDFHIVL